MITYVQSAHAIQTCAVGTVGVTLLFKILPMFRLDCFRQKMFAVRDELFDFAATGHISFDEPAYILLRRQMNGMIRYGHQLTLFRAMISSAMKKAAGDKQTLVWYSSWEKSLENLKSDEVRSQLRTSTIEVLQLPLNISFQGLRSSGFYWLA